MRELTDIEAAALGCVWKRGGATAYAVRRIFRESPSSRFSDSAGSVYPLIERLARNGLVRSRDAARGRRDGTRYLCTAKGLAALRRWLDVPATSETLITHDPLRTRGLFLGLLSAAERRRWCDDSERALNDHVATLEAHLGSPAARADRWLALAHRNAILQAHARLAWIREARDA